MAPDASGNGYWLVTATGHVYSFGDAPFLVAPGNLGPAVTSAVRTASGAGYGNAQYLGGPRGSVGDAPHDGGMNRVRLSAPIIATTGW
jgi:hypothetical protein